MALSSLGTGLISIAKGAIFPAVFVGAANSMKVNIPQFDATNTTTQKALETFGKGAAKAAWDVHKKITTFNPRKLPTLIRSVPKLATTTWAKNSTQIATAAVWGATTVATNKILKFVPSMKNRPMARYIVSVLVGAGAAITACELGLGETPHPHMFVDTALKVVMLIPSYKVATEVPHAVLGVAGFSSSILARGIAFTCKIGQGVFHALSFPETGHVADSFGAIPVDFGGARGGRVFATPPGTPSKDAMQATVLLDAATRTAKACAKSGQDKATIITKILRQHRGIDRDVAKYLADQALSRKSSAHDAGASTKPADETIWDDSNGDGDGSGLDSD